MILFVTGTDTGVGKTLVCGLLALAWTRKGHRVNVQKWVSTGDPAGSGDMHFIYSMLGRTKPPVPGSDPCPYCFSLPASPHLAAEKEGKSISGNRLRDATLSLSGQSEILIIEGVGGVLVPLSRDLLLADMIAELTLPVLVIARSRLGTLNHTLLTIEALTSRGVPITGVLLNGLDEEDPVIVEDNRRTLAELGGVEIFGPMPRVSEQEEALEFIGPVADRLWQLLEDCTWT
jgi:dethiobiotin synthetase